MTRLVNTHVIAAGVALCAAIVAQPAQAESASSDALILLEADGRHYTMQHTIASDGPMVALQLPENADLRHLSFLGPNQSAHQEHLSDPQGPIKLWDGVALVRYRAKYSHEVTQIGPDSYRLSMASLPQNFEVENGDISRSSYTWIFPESFELISYSAVSSDIGQWKFEGNELTYEQNDRFAVTLTIEYKAASVNNLSSVPSLADANDAFCFPTADNPDLCAEDTDRDSVPDYRDVCLEVDSLGSSLNTLKNSLNNIAEVSSNVSANKSAPEWHSLFGCQDRHNLILSDIEFPSGYSYLDVSSRESLDRLAHALQRTDDHFEIGAHTDNAGKASTNLALAKKRADTVRYYLLLRGVNPNNIRAKGYGEQYPAFDNATIEGRKNNRRIELTILK